MLTLEPSTYWIYSAAIDLNVSFHFIPAFSFLLGPSLKRHTIRRHKVGFVSSWIYFQVSFEAAQVPYQPFSNDSEHVERDFGIFRCTREA